MDQQILSFIDTHLENSTTMQIATTNGDKPWVATVWYVANEKRQMYWLSWPSRRHSKELAVNSHAAVSVVVQNTWPVVGLQMEGEAAEVVDLAEMKEVIASYTTRYGAGKKFIANVEAGTNEHHMYRFTPAHIVLIDEGRFPGELKEVILPE